MGPIEFTIKVAAVVFVTLKIRASDETYCPWVVISMMGDFFFVLKESQPWHQNLGLILIPAFFSPDCDHPPPSFWASCCGNCGWASTFLFFRRGHIRLPRGGFANVWMVRDWPWEKGESTSLTAVLGQLYQKQSLAQRYLCNDPVRIRSHESVGERSRKRKELKNL